MKKRVLSVLLAIVMVVGLFPVTAGALPASSHEHPVCGATHSDIGDHTGTCEDIPWTAWDGGSISASGSYYLSSSPESAASIKIGTEDEAIEVKLCLNGQTLSVTRIEIINATVDLCDCSDEGSGKIKGTGTDYTVYQYGTYQTEFNMYGGTISGISSGGAVNVDGYEADHTFNMYGGTVTNAYSSNTQTGAVYVCGAGGKLNMYGGTIKDCTGTCSGVYADGGATVTMAGGTIKNNNAGTFSGGVYLSGWSGAVPTFNMTGGSITDNQGSNGGGVYIIYGTFNMSGTAAISNNQSANGGGGVHMYHSNFTSVVNTFNMTGGSITNNTGLTGGGVDMGGGSASAFTMTGGTISDNKATGSGGGGMYLRKGTLSVSGTAAISDNTAENGGGVYLNGGTFDMSGTAAISGNTVSENGGGVYVHNGTFTVSGSPVITGNTKSGNANNVYLTSDNTITVNGELTGGNNSIGVKMAEPGVFAQPDGTNVTELTAADAAKFTSDDANFKPAVAVDDTKLSLVSALVAVTGVSLDKNSITLGVGGSETLTAAVEPDDATNKAVTWSSDVESVATVADGVVSAVSEGTATITVTTEDGSKTATCAVTVLPVHEHPNCGDAECDEHGGNVTFQPWTATDALPTGAGNYYLTNDVTISATTIPADTTVKLCLNGHTISSTADYMIKLESNVDFTITDCKGAGKLSHTCYSESKAVYANADGVTFNLYNGTIESTGRVYEDNNRSGNVFNQYGGSITSSGSKTVFIRYGSGEYNLYGGSVANTNDSDSATAVCVLDGNTQLTMSGNVKISAPVGIQVSKPIIIAGALETPSAPYTIYIDSDGVFTDGWSDYMSTAAPGDYFAATTYSAGYVAAKVGDELQLVEHTHGNWTYSYAPNGDGYGIITATCHNDDCPLNGGTGTATCNVIIHSDFEYKHVNYACPVIVETPAPGSNWVKAGLANPMVESYGLTEEPLKGTATLKVGEAEVTDGIVPFTLQKGTLTATDITLIPPDDRIYSGSAKEATFSTWGDAIHLVTIYYEGEGLVDGKPVDAGDYIVMANVEESDYYKEVNDLNIGSFDIAPKNISDDDVTFDAIPDQYYTGSEVQPKPVIKYNGMTLEEDTDYIITAYHENVEVGTNTAYVVINGTGNYFNSKTVNFTIDYAPLTQLQAFGSAYDPNAWSNDPNGVTFDPVDSYTVSTSPNSGYGDSVSLFGNGSGTSADLYVKDGEGNIYKVTVQYNYDTTAPGVEVNINEPLVWSGESKTITVSTTELISGIKSVELYVGDEKQENIIYTDGTFVVTEKKDYTVKVTDNAGNVTSKDVGAILIDKTAPVISAVAIDPAVAGDWYTSNPTVTVTATDGESGLNAAAYSFDGGENWQTSNTKTYTEDGTYTVTVWVKDAVGNIAKRNLETIKVDTTAPYEITVTATVGTDDYTSGSEARADVVITLTGGEDATSSFDKYQYKIGAEGNWQDIDGSPYTHTASTGAGGVNYTFRAVDKAGNASVEVPFTVKKSFPVRFNANIDGATGTMDDVYIYQGGAVAMPACGFAKPGYSFVGWYTSADCTGECYLEGNELTNVTESAGGGFDLYAKWQIDEYSVTIDLNGAGAEGPANATYTVESDDITIASPTRTGYTFTGWTGTGLAEATMTVTIPTGSTGDRTYTANWTANNYTVKFNADGGEGEMDAQAFTYGTEQALTANTFIREGYKFMGWALSSGGTGVDYVDKQVVSNLNAAPNGEVTLYAVWTRDIILSGDIVAPNVSDAENLDVVLVGLDGTKYPVSVTGSQSPYHYTVTVPNGEYQLIVKDTENNVTVTAKEELNEDKAEEPITMPTGNKNSIVDSTAAGDYAPIVGGIDTIAKNTEGSNVTVTLTVTHEPANEEDAEHDALMDAAGSQKSKLTFLEIDLAKNVDGTQSAITQTDDAIEIVIPFDTTRKQNFKVYRFHDGTVDVLTTTANTDGEYIEIGTGSVTIHAKKFSLYAIGYTDVIPYYPVAHSCTSKCDVCGGCEDAACTENACKDKCRLLGMNFTDVADSKWYTEPVAYVYHHGMMEGVGNNLFDINGTTTRAMIVTILWRLEGEPVVNYLMQFEDIPADTWYTEAVRWAASEKIVEGYSDTAFGPTDPITREQFATILWRYAKYKGYDVSVGEDTNILSYEDAFSISEYAIPAMQWACGSGMVQGMNDPDGEGMILAPASKGTRAQIATMIMRFCEEILK